MALALEEASLLVLGPVRVPDEAGAVFLALDEVTDDLEVAVRVHALGPAGERGFGPGYVGFPRGGVPLEVVEHGGVREQLPDDLFVRQVDLAYVFEKLRAGFGGGLVAASVEQKKPG